MGGKGNDDNDNDGSDDDGGARKGEERWCDEGWDGCAVRYGDILNLASSIVRDGRVGLGYAKPT